MNYRVIRNDELYHYGVKGMKWGVRRVKESIKNRFRKKRPEPEPDPYEERISIGNRKDVVLSCMDSTTPQEARKVIKEKFNDAYIRERVAKEMYDDPEMFDIFVKGDDGKPLFSRDEMKNILYLDFLNVDKEYGFVASYYGGDIFDHHEVEVECDGNGRVRHISLQG